MNTKKQQKRYRRHRRIRAKIYGTARMPRLCVFRSTKHIYAQLIDDEKGQTLVSASDLKFTRQSSKSKRKIKPPDETTQKGTRKDAKILTEKVAVAYEVGKLIAKKALEKKIEKVVFDRRGYRYHGRVRAVAEGAREGGIRF